MTDTKDTTTTETQAPVIAKLDDINREFAERAFHGTSFSPEKRGESRRQEYVEAVNGLYAELLPLAKTQEQGEVLAVEMERYRQGYMSRMNAYLASHTNVMSAMITGPARFPTARNQKRGQWADNKASELHEWEAKARSSIKQKLLSMRSEDVKLADQEAKEWKYAEDSISARFSFLDRIDAGDDRCNSRRYYEDIIIYTVQKLARAGNVRLTHKALALVKSYENTHELPAIAHNNRFWKLTELAEKNAAKAREQAAALANAKLETIAEAEGVKIISNPQADRVQIIFDAKPPADMIAKLKGEAWNWSRSEGAWQRKLTEAAKQSAKRVLDINSATTDQSGRAA